MYGNLNNYLEVWRQSVHYVFHVDKVPIGHELFNL